jgi:hypothetical protein
MPVAANAAGCARVSYGRDGHLSSRQMTSRDCADGTNAKVPMTTGLGGAEGDRTPDLLSAIQALSQMSYSPSSG